MGSREVATAVMFIILVICSQHTTLATNKYPVPFSDKPDWHGFIVNPPVSFAAVLHARVMAHALVLVTLNSSGTIDQYKAATLAYQICSAMLRVFPPVPYMLS